MTRFVSLGIIVVAIGACAGSRKGADAGGGPGPTPTPAASTAGTPSSGGSAQGQTCDDGKCAAGLDCISYYGIAGGAGPKFTSCEIRCQVDGKPGCPSGQTCVTVADGPGSVCRPPDM